MLYNASDDDGAPNTYDYDDSFIDNKKKSLEDSDAEDSGRISESEEEDIKQLVQDARSFLRNKKATKKV